MFFVTVVAAVAEFWPVILVIVALIIGGVWAAGEEDRVRARIIADADRRRELARRADLEHRQFMRGDPHGMYGVGWESYRRYRDALRRTD